MTGIGEVQGIPEVFEGLLRVQRSSITWFLMKTGTNSTRLKYLIRQNF